MVNTNLEGIALKVERLIGTLSVGIVAFERQDAFSTMSPEDVAGMLENVRDGLSEIKQALDEEIIGD